MLQRPAGARSPASPGSDWEPDPDVYDLISQLRSRRSPDSVGQPYRPFEKVASTPSSGWCGSWEPDAGELEEVRRITHGGRFLQLRAQQDVARGYGSAGLMPRPPRAPRGAPRSRLLQPKRPPTSTPSSATSASSTPSNCPASVPTSFPPPPTSGPRPAMPGVLSGPPPPRPALPIPVTSTPVHTTEGSPEHEDGDDIVIHPSPAVTPGAHARATADTPRRGALLP